MILPKWCYLSEIITNNYEVHQTNMSHQYTKSKVTVNNMSINMYSSVTSIINQANFEKN